MHHLHNSIVVVLNTTRLRDTLASKDEGHITKRVGRIFVRDATRGILGRDVVYMDVDVVFERTATMSPSWQG